MVETCLMKKNKLTFLLVCFILLLTACQENDDPRVEYAPGEIQLGLSNNLSVSEMFDLINQNNLALAELEMDYIYSTLPTENIPHIVEVMQSKLYVTYFSEMDIVAKFGNSPEGSLVIFMRPLTDLTIDNQQDWLETMEELQLTNSELGGRLLVRVTPGTEQYWINTFKSNPNVWYAQRHNTNTIDCVVVND
jgi:hypothetical protein